MYRWVDHTAEVELELEAASECELFADALRALAELLGFDVSDRSRDVEERAVQAVATDRAALLAAWLEELVFLAESDGFVGTELVALELPEDSHRLVSRVRGFVGDPPPLVKAVTLHRLLFERRGSGYAARVVLDV
jgi:SHS2 domain-containing protein